MDRSGPSGVAFLESAREVEAFLASNLVASIRVVATSPGADFAVERAGIQYLCIEDLYDEVELLSFGDSGWDHLKDVCRTIDDILGVDSSVPIPEFSAYYYSLSLKMFMDSLLRAAFVLKKAVAALKPGQVFYYPPSGPLPINEIGAIDTHKIFAYVLPLVCASQGVACTAIGNPQECAPPDERKAPGKAQGVVRALKRLLRVTIPGAVATLSGRRQTTVVVPRIWCDAGFAALRKTGMRVVPVSTLVHDRPCRLDKDVDLERLRPLFVVDGVDLYSLALEFFKKLIADWYPRHMRLVSRLVPTLASLGRVVVAGAGPVTVSDVATAVAARRAGVPSVVVQHGGFIGYAKYPILYLNDVFLSGHFMSWGPGVENELSQLPPDLPGSDFRQEIAFHSFGSPRLRDLRSRLRAGPSKPQGRKLRVVYVMTTLPRSFRYFSWNLYPDILAWRTQRRVVSLLLGYENVELILKPGRGDGDYNPLLDWLATQNAGDIPVRTDVSLAELLLEREVDVTILDTPATTLLEAVCGRSKAVALFLDSHLRLVPAAKELLERRAVVSETIEDYLADIKRVVDEALAGTVEEPDDAFLEHYALAGNPQPFESFADFLQDTGAKAQPARI